MLQRNWPLYVLAPLLAALAACTHAPAPAALPPVVAGALLPTAGKPAGAVDFRIDAAHSELRVLVYRGGALASLGHNHVVQSKSLAGWIRATKILKDSSFYLQVPVADLLIDQPAARLAEGSEFAEAVDDSARAGTLHNMLGAALLDADHFPLVLMQSTRIQASSSAGGSAAMASLRITIAGRTRLLDVPFTIDRQPESLHVKADFWLNQSALGLTPYSVMMGGLQVADGMHLKLDIEATADQAVGLD